MKIVFFIFTFTSFNLFNPNIFDSYNFKVILKKDIPKENISDLTGLNSPYFEPEYSY